MSNHQDRLRALESIEQDIVAALQAAATTVQELGKDGRLSVRMVEQHTNTFLKTVNNIESNLLKQIHYLSEVSTGYPHTSSSYSALKDYQHKEALLPMSVYSRSDVTIKIYKEGSASTPAAYFMNCACHQIVSMADIMTVGLKHHHTAAQNPVLESMAVQRSEHVSSRLSELEQLRLDRQSSLRQGELRRHLSHQSSRGFRTGGPGTGGSNLT